jgi:hypothetical protein
MIVRGPQCLGLLWATYRRLAIVTLAVALQACAPIAQTTREKKLIGTVVRKSEPSGFATATTSIAPDPTGFTVTAFRTDTCTVENIERYQIYENTSNAASSQDLLLLYGGAVVGVAIGALVLADAKNVPPEGDAKTMNVFTPEGVRGIGYSFVGTGGALLLGGVATSLRALNSREDLGKGERVIGTSVEPCDRKVLADAHLRVQLGAEYFALGHTDQAGTLHVEWTAMASFLLGERHTTASVDFTDYDGPWLPGTLELQSGKQLLGAGEIGEARKRMRIGDLAGAKLAIDRAVGFEADTSQVVPEWSTASAAAEKIQEEERLKRDTDRCRQHIDSAKSLLAKGKVDAAEAELVAASKLKVGQTMVDAIADAKLRVAGSRLQLAASLIRKGALDDVEIQISGAASLGADVDEMTTKLHEKRISRTKSAAAIVFAKCRKIGKARAAFLRLRNCDEVCRKTVANINADWEKLEAQVSALAYLEYWSDSDAALTDKCNEAGCPECPE